VTETEIAFRAAINVLRDSVYKLSYNLKPDVNWGIRKADCEMRTIRKEAAGIPFYPNAPEARIRVAQIVAEGRWQEIQGVAGFVADEVARSFSSCPYRKLKSG